MQGSRKAQSDGDRQSDEPDQPARPPVGRARRPSWGAVAPATGPVERIARLEPLARTVGNAALSAEHVRSFGMTADAVHVPSLEPQATTSNVPATRRAVVS